MAKKKAKYKPTDKVTVRNTDDKKKAMVNARYLLPKQSVTVVYAQAKRALEKYPHLKIEATQPEAEAVSAEVDKKTDAE